MAEAQASGSSGRGDGRGQALAQAPEAAGLPETDILIEDPRWAAMGLGELAPRAFAEALAGLGHDPARFAVSLLACDDARIRALNADFRGKDAPTNVLSWPAEERASAEPGLPPALPEPAPDGPPLELGDIAIAFDTCAREAAAAGISMQDHAAHLLIHALLHLLGYDHQCDADATLMEGIEARTLARMGISDPYERSGRPAEGGGGAGREQGEEDAHARQ